MTDNDKPKDDSPADVGTTPEPAPAPEPEPERPVEPDFVILKKSAH